MAHVRRRKVRLVTGPEDEATRKVAAKRLRQILQGAYAAPSALLVRDVIDRYLTLHQGRYSPEALELRRYYLRLFEEAHGWRKVNDRDWLPVHVEE